MKIAIDLKLYRDRPVAHPWFSQLSYIFKIPLEKSIDGSPSQRKIVYLSLQCILLFSEQEGIAYYNTTMKSKIHNYLYLFNKLLYFSRLNK